MTQSVLLEFLIPTNTMSLSKSMGFGTAWINLMTLAQTDTKGESV